MRLSLLVLVMSTIQAFEAPAPVRPPVLAASPLIEHLPDTLRPVTADHYHAALTLHGAIARNDRPAADLDLRLTMVAGVFGGGDGDGDGWRAIQVSDGTRPDIGPDGASGQVTVQAVIGGEAQEMTLILDAQAAPVTEPPDIPHLALEGRWWRIFPGPQSEAFTLTGRYRLVAGDGTEQAAGVLSGSLSLPQAPGLWDMGQPAADGIDWTFHMGDLRQNWNHARLAQHVFADGPVDLSAYQGLRIRVATDSPRHDVSLSLWLREHSGGWYYVKDGIPLAAATNEAVLLWEDFEEAEWVAPGNHMDSDFVLDVAAISHIGIGVVNPLGVGSVSCRLLSIEAVRCAVELPSPAQVTVSGRLLSVNDHEVVPAALFGGYAPELPQRYRPGCQRVLHFGLTHHPVIPRQRFARLNRHRIEDPDGLLRSIHEQAESKAEGLPGARIWGRLDQRFRERQAGGWLRNPADDQRERVRRAERLANALNGLLGAADLYDPQAWAAVALSDELQGRVQALAGEPSLTSTEIMELNRDLLHAAWPEHVAARPAYGPTERFIIDCQGERLHPATYFRRDDWREYLFELGRQYAINARRAGHRAVMEFWNEPYLNWAERSRIHFRVDFFRQDLAVDGGPVTVRRADGSTDDVIPYFQWVPARDDRVSQTDSGLMVIDTSAFSYWSGRGNGYIYDQMYQAIASGIRQENPDVVCVAGWGFRWHEDHWAAWDMIYRPTIDNNIDLIDGIHEHHYQGDPTDVTNSYEVLTAYGVTAHQRWLHAYNTETNDLVDAPARGRVEVPAEVESDNVKNYRRAIYSLRDILYAVAWSPDKAASRTVIHHDHTPHGTEVAYGLMRDLRGRLVEGNSDDDRVWVAASIDGSDPEAMPPEPGQRLVVMLFNDHRQPRAVELALAPPQGTSFAAGAFQARTVHDPATGAVTVERRDLSPAATGHNLELIMQGRSALLVQLPLEGEAGGPAEVHRRQFFSADLLQAVGPDQALETTIAVDPDTLAQARRAWLRVLVENVHPGAATVRVGEHDLELPTALTRDNGNRLFMIAVPTEALAAQTQLRFTLQGARPAYRVAMSSLVLEYDTE